jgi:CheY-like chemotaxis protein
MRPLQKVLAIDDDPDIRDILSLSLCDVGGLEVSMHGDVPSALLALPTFQPDLILLDVMLPGMSGVDALLSLRQMEQFSNTPIVFLTAKASAEARESYTALGASSVLFKPFDPLTLAEQLGEVWKESQLG